MSCADGNELLRAPQGGSSEPFTFLEFMEEL